MIQVALRLACNLRYYRLSDYSAESFTHTRACREDHTMNKWNAYHGKIRNDINKIRFEKYHQVAPRFTLFALFLLYHVLLYILLGKIRVRLEICRDRRDRRSCKIFVSCVNFSRKQRSFLHILQVYTHLNVNFLHNC